MSRKNDYRALNAKFISEEEAFNNRLKHIAETNVPNFNKNEYDLGTNWALQGMTLEDAGDMANSKSFQRGFERGRRLLLIQEMDNQTPKKPTK